MKILIVGAGLSGCTIARLLHDRGHDIEIMEKEDCIGGLCITKLTEQGLKYEPYGARTFHTKDPRIVYFVQRFSAFNGYTHRKGMILHGKIYPFPITRSALNDFRGKEQILKELANRPAVIDKTNFETACISIFGKTLYSYFIENYTRNMWGIEPRELTAEWAPKRLEFREDDNDELFRDQWQGLPLEGYSVWLQKMIENIPIRLQTSGFDPADYDVVVSTAPIDSTMNYQLGRLPYRSIDFEYQHNEPWEKDHYGTINTPQHERHIRKCNFNVLHRVCCESNIIQYQQPIPADENNMPMYPINTFENDALFKEYLQKICETDNICPLGRLGLFKYLDMDKAVETSFDMVEVVENYLNISSKERYLAIKDIRQRH